MIMEYYIDNRRKTKREFWRTLQGIASPGQKCLILDGKPIWIGGVEYKVVQYEDDEVLDEAR